MRTGNLFVISGPSGAGKGTLVARLLKAVPDAWVSVSVTTRGPRDGEIEDVSYHYISDERFDEMVANDELLEWATYTDHSYGTPRASVTEHLQAGEQVILEIDVQGAFQVRQRMPKAHLVFIEPPSLEELRARLEGRGTENAETIEKRLEAAAYELAHKDEYDYLIVNDVLDEAAGMLINYVNDKAEHTK